MKNQFDEEVVAKFEKETWSRCAANYMAGFGPLASETVNPLLDKAAVGEGKKVLDVGTGPGLVAAAAQARSSSVIGIDFSEKMLEEARHLYPSIEFRQASAETLPFEDGEFDAVVGNFMLHHCARPDKVLSEAHRVLKPDGKISFTVWADLEKLKAFGLFLDAVEEQAGNSQELPHGPLFGVADFEVFKQMCREAGFNNPSVEELDIAWKTDSIETLLMAFRDWANLELFPDEIRDSIENTVRRNSASLKSGNVYKMQNPALLISAEK